MQKSALVKILLSAVILVAALLLCSPVSALLEGLTASVTAVKLDWTVPFRLIILISGLVLLSGLLREFFRRWQPKSSRGRTAFTLSNSAFRYLLVLVGLMWGLNILGVDIKALLAGAGVLALIIGFGAESLIADVITGIFMLFEHQYEVGDIIVVGDFRGTVSQIGIRTTCITDSGGNVKIINNSDIRSLINRSSDVSFAVCDIAIPYHGYLRRAEELLEQVLPALYAEHGELFLAQPQYAGVQQMDPATGSVVLRVSAQVAEQDIYTAQRTLNRALLLAFEDAGIPSPAALLSLARPKV